MEFTTNNQPICVTDVLSLDEWDHVMAHLTYDTTQCLSLTCHTLNDTFWNKKWATFFDIFQPSNVSQILTTVNVMKIPSFVRRYHNLAKCLVSLPKQITLSELKKLGTLKHTKEHGFQIGTVSISDNALTIQIYGVSGDPQTKHEFIPNRTQAAVDYFLQKIKQ